MKTKLAGLSVVLVPLPMTDCNSSPQSLIVGKWEAGQLGAKLTAPENRVDAPAAWGHRGALASGVRLYGPDDARTHRPETSRPGASAGRRRAAVIAPILRLGCQEATALPARWILA